MFGVPNEDFGEEVKAVVQLAEGIDGDDEIAQQLIDHCRERLAAIKCPRSVDFEEAMTALGIKDQVNVILDMVGGDFVQKNINVAAPEGRIPKTAFTAFVQWAMPILSVSLQKGNAEMYRKSGLVISREQGLAAAV